MYIIHWEMCYILFVYFCIVVDALHPRKTLHIWHHVPLPAFYADNTASILTRHGGFSRLQKRDYRIPVVITDGDYPRQSSTNTLVVHVCPCDRYNNMESCNPEALSQSAGLSTAALVAILLCIVILLSERGHYGHQINHFRDIITFNISRGAEGNICPLIFHLTSFILPKIIDLLV